MDIIKDLKIYNKVEEAIERLGGNEELYLFVCRKFIDDANYQQYQTHIKAGDYKAAGVNLHTLKGIAANLGFFKLELLCKDMQKQLESGNTVTGLQIGEELSEEYHRIIDILS